ncbi:MAG: hypothetical protein QOI12_2246 [Alphaproteobacteria bacterium]|jgi:hypothetical protein|nr:hypothetical protein [Alphaproteobacteria bacterium]
MNQATILIAVALALAATLPAAPAQALNARSFVSGHGSDTNDCSLPTPCRTFAHAITVTSSGGEIDVLDVAGYGALTIDRAISIVNDGVGTARILLPVGDHGIIINAGPNDAINLRGLIIEGAGAGVHGILFNTGRSLTIENCVIRHVNGTGISFVPSVTSDLAVSNTLVADNGDSGILVQPTGSAIVSAVFNRVEVNNNGGYGIAVNGAITTGRVDATASESVAARNALTGFFANGSGPSATTFSLFQSVAANNGTGISAANANAILRAAHSMVTGNIHGWSASSSGVIESFGDNYIAGNGTNTGVLTSVGKQ